jgi:hypothetical protein
MRNIPPKLFEEIRQAIRRPTGSFVFHYHSADLFNPEKPGNIILNVPSGGHLFRLVRTDDLLVRFYHYSPGTGTRVAEIDLKEMPPSDKTFMAFTWSTDKIELSIGPMNSDADLHSATGVQSSIQFRVGENGEVYQVGDEGVDVMSVRVYRDGKATLLPTALDVWRETTKAAEVLLNGQSEEGYIHEVAVSNVILSVMVTGLEAYTKRRFLELEEEGIQPDVEALIRKIMSRKEREAGIAQVLESEAHDAGKSVLAYLVDERKINFQNYSDCKNAFNKAYGLRFGDLGLDSRVLAPLKQYIQYRHRIVHVSPLLGMLNQSEVPPEDPVFSNKAFAQSVIDCFDTFIQALHCKTLELTRAD